MFDSSGSVVVTVAVIEAWRLKRLAEGVRLHPPCGIVGGGSEIGLDEKRSDGREAARRKRRGGRWRRLARERADGGGEWRGVSGGRRLGE